MGVRYDHGIFVAANATVVTDGYSKRQIPHGYLLPLCMFVQNIVH